MKKKKHIFPKIKWQKMMRSQNPNPFLIVGAGPVGMVLAILLLKNGIKPVIIDKRASTAKLPRAINLSGETLEILKEINCLDAVFEKGKILKKINIFWNKERISSIQGKYFQNQSPYFFHIEQLEMEKIMLNHLKEKNIEILTEHELIQISENNSDFVETKIKNNQIKNETWCYVIGCDGAQSIVRKQLQLSGASREYDAYFILADVTLIGDRSALDHLDYFFTEQGYFIYAPLPEKKSRLIFSFKGRFSAEIFSTISEKKLEEWIKERSGLDCVIEKIHWSTGSDFYHQIFQHAGSDRVFLAGDSLHQFSPVFGTNMNMGIADAYCLAKLISGEQADPVLAMKDYEQQRLKAAFHNLSITEWATEVMTQTRTANAEEKIFLSILCNKNILREILPKLFSTKINIDFINRMKNHA